jgi:cobalt-zinc-cadmium efflux system membrane fusion protein
MQPYLIILVLLFHAPLIAADGHGNNVAQDGLLEGPHSGRLLESETLNLEITLFESGIPPEMRIYPYQPDGSAIAPSDVSLIVTLNRTGGQRDRIDFNPEQDYLVGNTEIVEPHSFEIVITAHYQQRDYQWQYDSFEGRAEIAQRLIDLSGVRTETAGPKSLNITSAVYGIITQAEDKVYHVYAPYSGIVKSVDVVTGDSVKKGQRLLTVVNQKTLQTYEVISPASGEVTFRPVKRGSHTDLGVLIEVSDLSTVWVELSMFPKDIDLTRKGMRLNVVDLHDELTAITQIDYISPQMTGGHIARARASIANPDGIWRPGMHVKAEILIDQVKVSLAVKRSALQTFRDRSVVFGRFGDVFEVRMLELGRQDNDYVEVLNGLKYGTEYVTDNSYLLKADILKDGASHSH